MPNLYLIGFMAAGKSVVGGLVAGRLGLPFVDLDALLEQRFKLSIAEIFEQRGEAVFRRAEREALEDVVRDGGHVVAVGGGAFCDPANRSVMHSRGGQSVFLDVPWPTLVARLEADHDGRPRYRGAAEAQQLYNQRWPHYATATWTVRLDGSETPDEVADRVVEVVSGAACAS